MYVQHPYKYEGKYYAKIDGVFYEISKEVAMAMFAEYRNEIYRSRKWAPESEEDDQMEDFQDLENKQVYSIRITVNSIRNDGTTRKDPGNGGKPRKIKGFSELMKRGGTRIDTFFEKRAHFSEQKEKLSTLSTKRAGKPHKQRVPGSFLNWNE